MEGKTHRFSRTNGVSYGYDYEWPKMGGYCRIRGSGFTTKWDRDLAFADALVAFGYVEDGRKWWQFWKTAWPNAAISPDLLAERRIAAQEAR